MKVLGATTSLYGKQFDKMIDLGYKGSHNQFRIICKCRIVADANRKCELLGIAGKVFRPGWYSETGNEKELNLCETNDIWISVDGSAGGKHYVPAEEIFCK